MGDKCGCWRVVKGLMFLKNITVRLQKWVNPQTVRNPLRVNRIKAKLHSAISSKFDLIFNKIDRQSFYAASNTAPESKILPSPGSKALISRLRVDTTTAKPTVMWLMMTADMWYSWRCSRQSRIKLRDRHRMPIKICPAADIQTDAVSMRSKHWSSTKWQAGSASCRHYFNFVVVVIIIIITVVVLGHYGLYLQILRQYSYRSGVLCLLITLSQVSGCQVWKLVFFSKILFPSCWLCLLISGLANMRPSRGVICNPRSPAFFQYYNLKKHITISYRT